MCWMQIAFPSIAAMLCKTAMRHCFCRIRSEYSSALFCLHASVNCMLTLPTITIFRLRVKIHTNTTLSSGESPHEWASAWYLPTTWRQTCRRKRVHAPKRWYGWVCNLTQVSAKRIAGKVKCCHWQYFLVTAELLPSDWTGYRLGEKQIHRTNVVVRKCLWANIRAFMKWLP